MTFNSVITMISLKLFFKTVAEGQQLPETLTVSAAK